MAIEKLQHKLPGVHLAWSSRPIDFGRNDDSIVQEPKSMHFHSKGLGTCCDDEAMLLKFVAINRVGNIVSSFTKCFDFPDPDNAVTQYTETTTPVDMFTSHIL